MCSAHLDFGTGKTTYLQRAITDAAERHGSDAIIVASFTRTAALELAGRDLPIRDEQVGTLHSHGYRAIGHFPVAETKLEQWSQEVPAFALAKVGEDEEERVPKRVGGEGSNTEELFKQYQFMRATMRPRDIWPGSLLHFARVWEEWKRSNGYVDFTDMVEIAYHDVERAPGNPIVGFFDEVQDFNSLELALVRKWGAKMEFFITAGDDDQAVYTWLGATPEAFLDPPVDEDHKRVLAQSYRVPRAIERIASSYIMEVARREPKVYQPRDAEGEVRFEGDINWRNPERVLDDMQRYLAVGKSIMILGSASYMLDPIKHLFREEGVPFWNPYRRERGDWNPLTPSRGIATRDRLLAFLRPRQDVWGDDARIWTGADLKLWEPMMRHDAVFTREMRKAMAAWPENQELDLRILQKWIRNDVFLDVMDCEIDWLEKYLGGLHSKRAEFPIRVARAYGAHRLREDPPVVIGTIHSVKGGEAAVVYLFQDLSYAAGIEKPKPGGHDAIRRLFYVGMTRAKESLVLCGSCSHFGENIQ